MTNRVPAAISDHAGLILSLAAATFVGLRVMSVAAWNPVTAQIILTAQSPPAVIAGTLIQLLPLVPVVLGLGFFLTMHATGESARPAWASSGLAIVAVISLVCIPWRVAALLCLLLVILMVLRVLLVVVPPRRTRISGKGVLTVRWSWVDRDFGPWTSRIVIFWAVLIAAVVVFSPRSWLPTERIVSERGTVVGYVLQVNESDALVLVDDPRFVARIDGAIRDRQHCVESSPPTQLSWLARAFTSRPLIGAFAREGGYEPCSIEESHSN